MDKDSAKAKSSGDGVGASTVRRSCELLEAAVSSADPRGLAELTQVSGLNKSTTYRLLRTFEDANFLRRTRGRAGYTVGPKLIGMAATIMHNLGVHQASYPSLDRLAAEVRETTSLSIRSGDCRVVVAGAQDHSYALRRNLVLGEVRPLHTGCAATAILAFVEDSERQDVVTRLVGPERRAEVFERLAVVRTDGYSVSIGESHPGIAGVAVPVFLDSEVFGSVTCAGPVDRWTRDRMIGAVERMQHAAAELAAELRAE